MQTKNNLVRKVMSGVSGLALLVSLEGCGTTIHYLDPETKVWYDCNTNEDYPVGHPCYSEVAKYEAAHRSSSSSSSSSSGSGRDIGGGGYGGPDKGGCSDHCERGGHH